MKIYKTSSISVQEKDLSFAGDAMKLIRPPMLGISIGWNTTNLLKPYIAVEFWHWLVQIGWLVN